MNLYEFLFNHPFPGTARHEAFDLDGVREGRLDVGLLKDLAEVLEPLD